MNTAMTVDKLYINAIILHKKQEFLFKHDKNWLKT
jgi:hypothetical protein